MARRGGGGAYGLGTLFSITTGGMEKVLYDFHELSRGKLPEGDLAYKGGSLFGATLYGGARRSGTLFTLRLTE